MSEIVIYEDGMVSLEATVEKDTLWLSQQQIAGLFGVTVPTINEHIKNIYRENELVQDSTIRNFRIVQTEGKREAKVVCANFTHTTQYILKSKMHFLHNAFI